MTAEPGFQLLLQHVRCLATTPVSKSSWLLAVVAELLMTWSLACVLPLRTCTAALGRRLQHLAAKPFFTLVLFPLCSQR